MPRESVACTLSDEGVSPGNNSRFVANSTILVRWSELKFNSVRTRKGSSVKFTECIATARFELLWVNSTGAGAAGAGVAVDPTSKSVTTMLWSDGRTPLSSSVPSLLTTFVLLRSRVSGMLLLRTSSSLVVPE